MIRERKGNEVGTVKLKHVICIVEDREDKRWNGNRVHGEAGSLIGRVRPVGEVTAGKTKEIVVGVVQVELDVASITKVIQLANSISTSAASLNFDFVETTGSTLLTRASSRSSEISIFTNLARACVAS